MYIDGQNYDLSEIDKDFMYLHKETWCLKAIYRLRTKAKRDRIAFNITDQDLVFPDYCPIFNLKLVINNSKVPKDNSPSVDRIDSKKGYIKGNVHIISHRANRIKNDATPEELRKVANYVEQLNIER